MYHVYYIVKLLFKGDISNDLDIYYQCYQYFE